jgi:hypothetical protein
MRSASSFLALAILISACGGTTKPKSNGAAGADSAAGAGGVAASGSSGSAAGEGGSGGSLASAGGASGGGGSDGGADAGIEAATGFNVALLPGLSLWLDAAKVDGAPNVIGWKDQSSNKNDFLTIDAQLDPSAVNGLPAVALVNPAQSDALLNNANGKTAPSLGFGTGELLVEVVAKLIGPGALFETAVTYPGQAFQLSADETQTHVVAAEECLQCVPTVSVSSTKAVIGDGKFHLVGAHRTGSAATTTLEVRIDGAVDASAMGAIYDQDLQAAATGAQFNGQSETAEIVVVKGPISADDLARLEGYLLGKYGLK